MNRALFLRRLALGSAGLMVGEEALDAFARLTHQRKSFPSAAIVTSRRIPVYVEDFAFMGAAVIPEGGYECVVSTPAIRQEWLDVKPDDVLAKVYDQDGALWLTEKEYRGITLHSAIPSRRPYISLT